MDTTSAIVGVLLTIGVAASGFVSCLVAKPSSPSPSKAVPIASLEETKEEVVEEQGEQEGEGEEGEGEEGEGEEEKEEQEAEDVNDAIAQEETKPVSDEPVVPPVVTSEPTSVPEPVAAPAPEPVGVPLVLKTDLDSLRSEFMALLTASNKKSDLESLRAELSTFNKKSDLESLRAELTAFNKKSDLESLRTQLVEQLEQFDKKHESHDYKVDSLMRTTAAHNQKLVNINEKNDNQLKTLLERIAQLESKNPAAVNTALAERITQLEANKSEPVNSSLVERITQLEAKNINLTLLDENVKKITQNVSTIDDTIEQSINTLTATIYANEDSTKQTLNSITEKYSDLLKSVGGFQQKIAEHDTKLTTLDLNVKPADIESLKRQVLTLTNQMSEVHSLKSQIATLTTQLSEMESLKSQLTANNSSLAQATTTAESLKAEVTKCQSELALSSASSRLTGNLIQELTKQTKALETRVLAQETVVDTHTAPLRSLQESVQTQDAAIAKMRKGLDEVTNQCEGLDEIVNKIGIIEVALDKKNKAKKGGLFG